MTVSYCKTAQCDHAGCDTQKTLVGYEAQYAELLLREAGWWVGGTTALVMCPEHAGEVLRD